jgi:catalase
MTWWQQHPRVLFRDPLRSPDLNHAIKRSAHRHAQRGQQLNFYRPPEALHQVTIVMSDRGIPARSVTAGF